MTKRHLLYVASFAVALCSQAQTQMTTEKYQLADERQLWNESLNAAGLAHDMRDSSDNRGVAYFDMQHQSGSYHRIQEGNQQNQLRFFTERYQKIGRYLYGYGSFDFNMGRTKERAWSDVLRTYNSNPFISGSSVFGKYDHQNFALNAKLASVRLGHFNYGAALYYKVGDLSRLRDPRSRIRLTDYQITPSATYTFGEHVKQTQHTLGFAAWYHRYKEKLSGLTTVQEAPDLKYYEMSGLEYARGTAGGYSSYWREYVNHQFGGELSYAVNSKPFHTLNSLSFQHGSEDIFGQYKYEPGHWYTNKYGFNTKNRLQRNNMLHSIEGKVSFEEGYADQYNQELITERNGAYTTQYWKNKMTYRKRYQLKKLDWGVHYRLSFTDNNALAGYAGLTYNMQDISNKHLLATSELKYSASKFTLEGGYGFVAKRLWVKAEASYKINHKSELSLSDATSDYAIGVLLPDMDYYRANYWQGNLEVMYQQPLTIKGTKTLWFAKLYGTYLHTNNSLESKQAGVSVGLYY